jgi:hypothetical protein
VDPVLRNRDNGKAQIVNGSSPFLKDRSNRGVAFGENAEELAATVIRIEVGVELGMIGFDRDRAGLLSKKFGDDHTEVRRTSQRNVVTDTGLSRVT